MSTSSENIKWELQIIFIYYTSYADRNNFRMLKQQNYRRFLIDSETVKHESSLVHFDIAFQKLSHSAIIFKDFLALVPEIAEIKYKKMTRAQAFKQYICKQVQPLYAEILQKSDFGQDLRKITDSLVDPNIHRTLYRIQINEKIFNEYIGNTRHAKDPFQIFQTFNNFLKEFQLSPQLISKSMAYILYLHLIRMETIEQAFNYSDFITAIILIGEVSARKISTFQFTQMGRVTSILERMEISQGFDKISKRVTCETAMTPSILKRFLEAQKQSNPYEENQMQFSRAFPSSTRHKKCNSSSFNFQTSKVKLQQDNYNSVKDVIEQESISFSKDSREIKQAFEDLCSYGEVANTKTLKSFKIKKLFERNGLISVVGKTWIDIQIVNLQRSCSTGKIQFPQFLELLSLTAKKIDAPFAEICRIILEEKQHNDRQMIEQSRLTTHPVGQYTEADQQILKGILSQAQKQLERIYYFYSADQKLMSFSQLSKCMYDLELFPGILSKNKLFHIFSALSEVRQGIEEQIMENEIGKGSRMKTLSNYLKDEKMIEFSGFLLGIIEIAQQICDPSLAPPQKLIVLMEKTNDTKGYKRINSISLVNEIRKKFGSYYAMSFRKSQRHVQDFDQLVDSFN